MKESEILLIVALILLMIGISERSKADVVGIQERDNASFGSLKATIYELPWWAKTLASIKLKGDFKLGDLLKEPDTTVPISLRSSVRISDHSRLKVKVGGYRSSVEYVRYMSDMSEWYLHQESDDSTVGYRFRF